MSFYRNMLQNLFIFMILFSVVFSFTPVESATQNQNVLYQEIGPGLWWARVGVQEGREKVDTVIVVKIDPKKNRFRIFYDKNTKTIEEWQRLTGASVVFNGSYFRENLEPCSLVISDGQVKGPAFNRYMKGMFLAEPRKDGLPRATIIDLSKMSFLWTASIWEQGLQSFPLLVDRSGSIKVNATDLRASRTVICTTKDDFVLVIHSEEAYFTLYDLAKFLKSLSLNLDAALNLDGGMAAEICVKNQNVDYVHYGYQSSSYGNSLFFIKGIQNRIPMAVAIYPRQ